LALIHLLNDNAEIIDCRGRTRQGKTASFDPGKEFVRRCLQAREAVLWTETAFPRERFAGGMTVVLRHGEQQMGLLTLISQESTYEDNHLLLLTGIGRQAAMALRNAQLYQIQADYALHLEDMVSERTQELQSAQQLLIRSEKLASIGQLAASIAHEINNPLMPIGLNLERLTDELKESGVPIDFGDIEMIQEHVERIRRIVRNLLEFARPDANLRPLDIRHILEGEIKLNQKFFEHERIRIETSFAPVPPVFGSKDQLEAVFMNLALNAQAAMEGGGTLTFKTYDDSDQAVIECSDTGHGIPDSDIDRIFDPFFSTKTTGTGLGLFVCYSVVEGHHGTIEVKSKVGKGTRFTIRLPSYHE
jgi:signal transduction histidine kinase